MQRFRAVSQTAVAVLLLSLLLTACRVTEVPATTYPGVASYPAPQTQRPTRAPTVVQTATQPTTQTTTRLPNPPRTRAATIAPTQATTPGEVAFTVTILYTGEVAGEVSPCG